MRVPLYSPYSLARSSRIDSINQESRGVLWQEGSSLCCVWGVLPLNSFVEEFLGQTPESKGCTVLALELGEAHRVSHKMGRMRDTQCLQIVLQSMPNQYFICAGTLDFSLCTTLNQFCQVDEKHSIITGLRDAAHRGKLFLKGVLKDEDFKSETNVMLGGFLRPASLC